MGFLKHIDTILNSAELGCDDGSPLIRNILWSVTVLMPVVMTHHCKVVSSQIRSQLTTHEFVAVAGDESDLLFKLLIDHSQFSDIKKKKKDTFIFICIVVITRGVCVCFTFSLWDVSGAVDSRQRGACMYDLCQVFRSDDAPAPLSTLRWYHLWQVLPVSHSLLCP